MCESRARGLSFSFILCLPSTRLRHDLRCASSSSFSLFVLFSFPLCTYRNIPNDVPFAVLSMTRNSYSSPSCFPPPRTSLALIEYWMLSHLCFVRLYLYLRDYAERTMHIVANCVLAIGNTVRRPRGDYLRTLFR